MAVYTHLRRFLIQPALQYFLAFFKRRYWQSLTRVNERVTQILHFADFFVVWLFSFVELEKNLVNYTYILPVSEKNLRLHKKKLVF